MKKLFVSGLLILSILFAPWEISALAHQVPKNSDGSRSSSYDIIMKQDILTLMMAYPENIIGVEIAEDEKVFVITSSGKKILYDDKQNKDLYQKMDNSDIQDILQDIYPLTMIENLSGIDRDPGRFRNYPLLNQVYGSSEREVSSNLIGVSAPYRSYQFNKNNKSAESLKIVMEQLKEISKSNGAVAGLINPVNGTFNYRVIAGTGKLSPHAYGIAIDLNSNPSDYWKWATREAGEKRMLSYPKELVETFEKNNFVWGGKWGHFDTLHFEYRPEIIIKAKYFGNQLEEEVNWYGEVPRDEKVNEYISIIESVIN